MIVESPKLDAVKATGTYELSYQLPKAQTIYQFQLEFQDFVYVPIDKTVISEKMYPVTDKNYV